MRISRITDGDRVGSIFDDLVAVSFPPDERCTRDELIAWAASGAIHIHGLDDDGQWAGAVMLEEHGEPQIVHLSWLAVAPSQRGSGAGSMLLDHALDRARALGAHFLIGEMEDPGRPIIDPRYGDPARRAGFYRRHGAKALAIPYQQPPLGPELSPVPLMLIVWSLDGADSVPTDALRRFLHNYVGDHEPTWQMVEPWLTGEQIPFAELSSQTFRVGR